MSKFTRPLCSCGCKQPRRPGSKYYSEKCQQAVARLKARERRARWSKNHAEERKENYRLVNAPQKGALVYFRECALPVSVSKTEANAWLDGGLLQVGDRVEMDGKTIPVPQEAML